MRTAALVLLAVAGGLLPVEAGAQGASRPRFESSTPRPAETARRAPALVSITFSEKLGPESRMVVSDQCGRRVDDGSIALRGRGMTTTLISQPRGSYTVTYVARGEDGSGPVRGRFAFTARRGARCNRDGHAHHAASGSSTRARAAGQNPGRDASARDVLVALGLAAALGALGGLILRASPQR